MHAYVHAQSCPALCACGLYAAAAAKSLQSCPTLCDPIDRSPPGSPVPGILQATTVFKSSCVPFAYSSPSQRKPLNT